MSDIKYKENGKDIIIKSNTTVNENLDLSKNVIDECSKRNSDINNPFVLSEDKFKNRKITNSSSKQKKTWKGISIELIFDIILSCLNFK